MRPYVRVSVSFLLMALASFGLVLSEHLAISHLAGEAAQAGCSPQYLLATDLMALFRVPNVLMWPSLMVFSVGWATVLVFMLSVVLFGASGELLFLKEH